MSPRPTRTRNIESLSKQYSAHDHGFTYTGFDIKLSFQFEDMCLTAVHQSACEPLCMLTRLATLTAPDER